MLLRLAAAQRYLRVRCVSEGSASDEVQRSPQVACHQHGTATVTFVLERLQLGSTRAAVGSGLVVAAALMPLLFLGPGTDLDTGVVLRSARGIVDHFAYQPSRPPGAPVHEALVGVLDRMGGLPLINAGSLAMAALCAVSLYSLCRRAPVRQPLLTTAVVVANPWFLVAATSLADFVWALGFLLAAAWALRLDRPRPWLAGVLAAAAVGSRAATLLLVVALLIAEAWDGAAGRKRAVVVGAITAVFSVMLYVPAYRAAGGLSFARNDFRSYSLFVSAGRFAAKDLYLLGPLAVVALLLALPRVLRLLGRWGDEWLVRFAASGLVLSQVLFFRFPWKMGHLLPTLVCVALLLGLAVGERPRLLAVVVALQLLYGVVNIRLLAPDKPNQATSARFEPAIAWGPLVTDTKCRDRYEDNYRSPSRAVREKPWNCAAPFGSDE